MADSAEDTLQSQNVWLLSVPILESWKSKRFPNVELGAQNLIYARNVRNIQCWQCRLGINPGQTAWLCLTFLICETGTIMVHQPYKLFRRGNEINARCLRLCVGDA